MSLLVLCVDRDNDLGEKAKVRGPVIGAGKNKEAANRLLLADPEDNDANTMFAAIKIAKENGAEVATVTGDKRVGVKSDSIIEKQMDIVIKQTGAKKAIIVTDGVEDELVLPVVQSKLQILSVHRVIIKQSERLEGMYYMIKNFIRETVTDPHMSRMILGVPAIILLILAIFGMTGWRIILAAIGFYLFIKGFHIEGTITGTMNEFISSFRKSRVSFFLYTVGIVFVLVGIWLGYSAVNTLGAFDIFTEIFTFIHGSIYAFFAAAFAVWVGKLLIIHKQRHMVFRHATLLALIFAVTVVARAAVEMAIRPEVGLSSLVFSIVTGFIALSITLALEHTHK